MYGSECIIGLKASCTIFIVTGPEVLTLNPITHELGTIHNKIVLMCVTAHAWL